MSKFIKLLVVVVLCFFAFEAYLVFTHRHPQFQQLADKKIEKNQPQLEQDSPQLDDQEETPVSNSEPSNSENILNQEGVAATLNEIEESSSKNPPSHEKIEKPLLHPIEESKPPRLVIVFVADAAGKNSIDKISSFFKGGIHLLQEKAVKYENAFYPHANCSTAQGHAGFMTGTFPAYHGMVNNYWLDAEDEIYGAVQDNDLSSSAVYNPWNGSLYNVDETGLEIQKFYKAGVSPRNYKVDGVSDQILMNTRPGSKVISVSTAYEPAVLMAGFFGKAFWMDPMTGLFTTGKYFFPQGIPDWVDSFNKTHKPKETFVWDSAFPLTSRAYDFLDAQNYSLSRIVSDSLPVRSSFFGKTLPSITKDLGAMVYNSSPEGIKVFYEFVNTIIDSQKSTNEEDRLVLFVNNPAFDLFAGYLGPQTQEAIDVLYHIDQGMEHVMKHAQSAFKPEECLFVFLSDEGYYPSIPELLEEKGLSIANRLIANFSEDSLVVNLNQFLGSSLVKKVIAPFVYMDRSTYGKLDCIEQRRSLQKVKYFLRTQKGIKDAWTFEELTSQSFDPFDVARFYKLHAFKNNPNISPLQERRSGEVIFQTFPFTYITNDMKEGTETKFGSGHSSCYAYDSQSCLFVYQPGVIEGKKIYDPVYMQQLAVTLSELLNVPRPSAASYDLKPLPGVFDK